MTAPVELTQPARELRGRVTLAERRLWPALRGDRLGLRFRRQLSIGQRHIADFCAPGPKLIIDADGGQHAGNAADALRTAGLQRLGHTVLRVRNTDILRDPDAVLRVIRDHITTARGAADQAPPLSRGVGALPRRDGGEGLSAVADQTKNGNT